MEKTPLTLSITYQNKLYVLEYTRATVQVLETSGFNPNDIGDKMMTRLPQMFAGAFLAHHRGLDPKVIEEIYSHITKKTEMFAKLREMYNATLATLLEEPEEGDPGNVDWTASF